MTIKSKMPYQFITIDSKANSIKEQVQKVVNKMLRSFELGTEAVLCLLPLIYYTGCVY
jgi:hypothetical protein